MMNAYATMNPSGKSYNSLSVLGFHQAKASVMQGSMVVPSNKDFDGMSHT